MMAYSTSPIGLERVVPTRWMVSLPGWARARFGEVAAWQWLMLTLGLLVGALFIFGFYRLARRLAARREEESGASWHALLTPLAIILVMAFLVPTLCTIFRIGGSPRVVIAFVQTSAMFLTAAWLSMIGANILADTIVSVGASDAPQPGRPADQAGHALCRHLGCHRVLDPRGG